MKRKGVLFVLGVIGVLSIGALSFAHNNVKTVKAVIDAGEIQFTKLGGGSGTNDAVYIATSETDVIPTGYNFWSGPYKPVEGQGGVYINDSTEPSLRFQLQKANTYDYYFKSLDGAVAANTTLKLFGLWAGNSKDDGTGEDYQFTILESTVIKTSTGWQVVAPPVVVPELDVYDKATLKDAGIDDYDRQSVNLFATNSAWNSFEVSPENTKKNFAFEFLYESYKKVGSHIEFRVGAQGVYYGDHHYHFIINNSWGTNGQYCLIEGTGDNVIYSSEYQNFPVDIKTGRHTFEFGSIYLANDDTKTFDYVKLDGEYIYTHTNTPASSARTTKVDVCIPTTDFFIGSSMSQRERDTTISFNRTNDGKGIYLNGPVNDIPVNQWNVRAVPGSKYNALLNGEPMYEYGSENLPLVKHSIGEDDNYYIAFDDSGISFKTGDVVTLSDEFHFFWNNVVYVLSLHPVSFLYNGTGFVPINDIYEYLSDSVVNRCLRDLYSDENLAVIDQIVSEAQSAMPLKTNMKQLWDLYLDYIAQLDLVPLDEEKAQEVLRPTREAAVAELNEYVVTENYSEAKLEEIATIISNAATEINACMSVSGIAEIVINTKALIDEVPTILDQIEEEILSSNEVLDQYLETYDVVTTTDLCATGGLNFYSDNTSYSSGNMKDVTTRVVTSPDNEDGNMIFQFNYSSTNVNSRRYGAQVFIRLRGTGNNCYRFDVGSQIGSHSGLMLIINDKEVARFDANFQNNTTYKIECGTIDLDGYDRTLCFFKVNDQFKIKKIVDSLSDTQTPTVSIFDSYTTGDNSVTLSPIEEGTTKDKNASMIGSLSLDPSSNGSSLTLNARENSIPSGTFLYPLENNGLTINGQQINSNRPVASLYKSSSNTYEVNLDGRTYSDGDIVKLQGVYCSHDNATGLKKAYKLFAAEFTYHYASNSWTQTIGELSDVIKDAKEMLARYVDLDNYSEESKTAINEVINSYTESLDNQTSINDVQSTLNEALNQLDLIPTILGEYKISAKEILNTYAAAHNYREDEQKELNSILESAFGNIDKAEDQEDVDKVINEAKAEIDTLKTAEERAAEDLAAEKKVARTEVEMFVGLLELNRYSDESIALIRNLAFTARSDIENASNSEEIENIVNTFKAEIIEIETNDGSTFDGEKYIEPSKTSGGCGGNIVSTSIILSTLSMFGLLILLRKKHYAMLNK